MNKRPAYAIIRAIRGIQEWYGLKCYVVGLHGVPPMEGRPPRPVIGASGRMLDTDPRPWQQKARQNPAFGPHRPLGVRTVHINAL